MAKILIAPDSFKGSATSNEVAHALRKGWLALRSYDEVSCVSFADGGEGTLDCVESVSAVAARIAIHAQGATGRTHLTSWLLVNGDTAVIEMAALCGITTVEKLDPLGAHSFGLGQAIKDALSDARVKEILIAVGGSASTDGGTGALQALGFRFLDRQGKDVHLGGGHLHEITENVAPHDLVLPQRGVKVLVDVQSPLVGKTGAAHIFAPQKGANHHEVSLLDAGLTHLLEITGKSDRPGYGAAGGVSFGLSALLGAEIVSGVHTIASLISLDEKIADCDLVITGEGSFDAQSFSGKVVGYILGRAKDHGVQVAIACGVNKNDIAYPVVALADIAPSIDSAIADSQQWLVAAGKQLAAGFNH
ncbi:MAG: glycerate kinase [Candidatus Planktophila sp.]